MHPQPLPLPHSTEQSPAPHFAIFLLPYSFMMSPEWSVNKAGALDWGRHMRNIVDEAGEIIAKATDDHTLIGGHHRLAVAASLGRKLFWKDTGEPVKLDPYFKGSSHRHKA